MEKYGAKKARKVRGTMSPIVATLDANTSLADALRHFSAKWIARRVRTSSRTAENWLAGENGPTWKHTVAMLNDDELCALLLEAAGRDDLAHQAKVMAAKRKLRELEGG